jgi:hypothetical protein
MVETDTAPGTSQRSGRLPRLGGPLSWVIVAWCSFAILVYLALHLRELGLIARWVAAG